jgi:hypothetical protein
MIEKKTKMLIKLTQLTKYGALLCILVIGIKLYKTVSYKVFKITAQKIKTKS